MAQSNDPGLHLTLVVLRDRLAAADTERREESYREEQPLTIYDHELRVLQLSKIAGFWAGEAHCSFRTLVKMHNT